MHLGLHNEAAAATSSTMIFFTSLTGQFLINYYLILLTHHYRLNPLNPAITYCMNRCLDSQPRQVSLLSDRCYGRIPPIFLF